MADNKKTACEPPFWKDISVIFKDFTLEYVPNCSHSAWNFGVRLLILSLFVGMIASILGGLSAFFVTILFGLITAVVIVFTTKATTTKADDNPSTSYHKLPYIVNTDPSGYLSPMTGVGEGVGEGFVGAPSNISEPTGIVEIDASSYSGPALPDYTPPTARNMFMNVLLDEIKYNPNRPEAAPVDNAMVKQTMDDYFRVQWFSDPTDVFGKNQSQRQFVTQPSTTVPNDQGAFADWLYRIPGKTCKEGGREACLAGTDGSPVTWLNQDS